MISTMMTARIVPMIPMITSNTIITSIATTPAKNQIKTNPTIVDQNNVNYDKIRMRNVRKPINTDIQSVVQLLKHLKIQCYIKPFEDAGYDDIQEIRDKNDAQFKEMVQDINSILQERNYNVAKTFKYGHIRKLHEW